jgi:hypothetical protein
MSGRDTEARCPPIVPAVLGVFLGLGAGDLCAGGEAPRIEVAAPAASSGLNESVSFAVRDASSRLSDPACSRIFTDYRDSGGQTLQANLDALGRTGQSYVEWLNFYDGHGMSRCADRGTLASTSPGSRVVYICSRQFREKQRRDPGLAAALIIHEELHSLGLAENPPSSQEITARVISRCGR